MNELIDCQKNELLDRWLDNPGKEIHKFMHHCLVTNVEFITSIEKHDSDIHAARITLFDHGIKKEVLFIAGDGILDFVVSP